MPLIELRAGSAIFAVSPESGGSITRYASDHGTRTLEWLRPAPSEAIEQRSAGATSCFPMVPFSNRIRDARFHFRGRLIELPPNFSPEPHAIHGHAWWEPWEIIDQTNDAASIEYYHAADEWPWAYRARQDIALSAERVTVRMSVRNESPDPMPVGFGLHPYFLRTPLSRLRATVGQMWRADTNAMPAELVAPPPDLSMTARGLNPDATPLDNNFIRFGGTAVADWPEWNARLRLSADPVFRCLVIYTPPSRDFYCAEPATNCIDAFNLADMGLPDTGILVLAPGETRAGTVTMTPEVGD